MKLTVLNLFLLGCEALCFLSLTPRRHVSKTTSSSFIIKNCRERRIFAATATTSNSAKRRNKNTLTKSRVYNEENSFAENDTAAESISTILPKDDTLWKTEGERIIRQAAAGCGAKSEEVDIRWLPGKIIVTLSSGNTYLQAVADDGIDFTNETEYDEDEIEMMEDSESSKLILDTDEMHPSMNSGSGIDVVSVARSINLALGEQGEGSLPYNIAVHHEIEVTTPGASDELQGIMFESYRGFDVLVESIDSKKQKDKVIIVEGKLVERNDEQTIINVKGRIRKFKNELVKSVKLPKAKKEKGVK
jgi:hypothetical protein